MNLLPILLLMVTAGASESDAAAVTGQSQRRPNTVVITADGLGYADVGVHGGKQIPTPHIDSNLGFGEAYHPLSRGFDEFFGLMVFFFSDNGGPTGDNTSSNEPLRRTTMAWFLDCNSREP